MLNDDDVRRVLAVAAHPDDIDFGLAGTVASWTDAGIDVTYLIVTDGDSGGFDREVPRADIPGIRRAEQTEAAKCVGVSDVRFLGYPDGRLTVTFELRRDITRVIRQVQPERMVIHSPERNYARLGPSHPDHLAAGEAAICAVYPDARNPFAHPELLRDDGLDAWTVREVWMQGGPEPNRYVDITDTFDRKVAALRAHVSQTAHMDDLEDRLRGWLGQAARRAGMAEGRLAETFQVIEAG